ncbi:MAG: hypothetical protein ACRD3G_14960 [Vicinamibacterales bacterium]
MTGAKRSGQGFPDLIYAPPTRVHLFGDAGALYIYTPRLVSRLERR